MEDYIPAGFRDYHRFLWYLHNPFLPNEAAEALFCFRLPSPSWWKVTLQREERTTSYNLPVTFSLQFIPTDDHQEEVVQVTLSESISEVEDIPWTPPMQAYTFEPANRHTYTRNASINRGHIYLAIRVYISIQCRILGPQRPFAVCDEALMILINDLRRLLSDSLYHDLFLQSRSAGLGFPVHSCILRTRWPRFTIDTPPDSADPPAIPTGISYDVLNHILIYLYTSSIDQFGWNGSPDDKYKTEVFQVMDKFSLRHLHERLEQAAKVHWRNTMSPLVSSSDTFDLQSGGIHRISRWKRVLVTDKVDVTTSLKFLLPRNEAPSFRYSLEFASSVDLFARVTLEHRREVVRRVRRAGTNVRSTVVHEHHYIVPRNGRVGTGEDVPMEGDLAHLSEFIAGGDRTEGRHAVKHSFRFTLYVSTGKKLIETATHAQIRIETEKEGYDLLGYHMSVIHGNRVGADLSVVTVDPLHPPEEHLLHKSILVIRAPDWRNVLQDIPEGGHIPNTVRCIERNAVFRCVVEYMYTAEYGNIPDDLVEAVIDFARRCSFSSLLRFEEPIQYIRFINQIPVNPAIIE